jgi:uncharacterized membrane protein
MFADSNNSQVFWIRFSMFVVSIFVLCVGIYLIQVDEANPIENSKTGLIVTVFGGLILFAVLVWWTVTGVEHFSEQYVQKKLKSNISHPKNSVGYQNPVNNPIQNSVGYQNSAVGYQNSAVGYQNSADI